MVETITESYCLRNCYNKSRIIVIFKLESSIFIAEAYEEKSNNWKIIFAEGPPSTYNRFLFLFTFPTLDNKFDVQGKLHCKGTRIDVLWLFDDDSCDMCSGVKISFFFSTLPRVITVWEKWNGEISLSITFYAHPGNGRSFIYQTFRYWFHHFFDPF